MSVVVASLVRNEADRYLPAALSAWSEFADRILVLDDNSDDGTQRLLTETPKVGWIARYGERRAWGAESEARRELWDFVMKETRAGDFVLWLDADMVPLDDPRPLFREGVDSYFFPLYDLWSTDAFGRLCYRDDNLWNAHFRPRCWAIRRPSDAFKADWGDRGLHSGHLPLNWQPRRISIAPPSHALLHYGWLDAEDREAKVRAYLDSDALTLDEEEHAHSALDPDPVVRPLFEKIRWPLQKSAS